MLKCTLPDSSDFGLQIVRSKHFWVAECQTQAGLGCRLSDSSVFGLQNVRLKRFGVADCQFQAMLGCRLSDSSDVMLYSARFKRFGIRHLHRDVIFVEHKHIEAKVTELFGQYNVSVCTTANNCFC